MARIGKKPKTSKKVKDVVIKPALNGVTYKSYIDEGKRYMICQNSVEGGQYFKGYLCGNWVKGVGPLATSVLCWKCTQALVPFEEKIVKKSDKPRGWAFMAEYVHTDGTVYHKGVEQPELKGTLPPTKIEEKKDDKPKLTKGQKAELKNNLLVEFNKLKKEYQKEKRKTYKAKIKSQMTRVQRELKKVK